MNNAFSNSSFAVLLDGFWSQMLLFCGPLYLKFRSTCSFWLILWVKLFHIFFSHWTTIYSNIQSHLLCQGQALHIWTWSWFFSCIFFFEQMLLSVGSSHTGSQWLMPLPRPGCQASSVMRLFDQLLNVCDAHWRPSSYLLIQLHHQRPPSSQCMLLFSSYQANLTSFHYENGTHSLMEKHVFLLGYFLFWMMMPLLDITRLISEHLWKLESVWTYSGLIGVLCCVCLGNGSGASHDQRASKTERRNERKGASQTPGRRSHQRT